jgi:hypothetical protein
MEEMMRGETMKFEIESLDVDVVPGSCAAAVGGGPCVIAVIVVIAMIADPSNVPGW